MVTAGSTVRASLVNQEVEIGEVEDLSHLHEAAQPIARLPAAERLAYVRAERWIGYTRATEALTKLETLLEWPERQRMPNLLLLGPTNNGKSMIIEKFRRSRRPISHPDREEVPVLAVQMPSDPKVARFYTALLTALGAPLRPSQRLPELEQLTLRLLRQTSVRMLVIDELHNTSAGRGDARREFLNLLRFLGNELRIPLVGVGTQEAYLAIRSDDQLENRFAPFVLPRWQPDEEACKLLASFAAAFPLRRPSQIATAEMPVGAAVAAPQPRAGLGAARRPAGDDLDWDPPLPILEALADRTGVQAGDLRLMTIGGWVPWLADTLDPDEGPDAFAIYVRQDSVLLWQGEAGVNVIQRWRPWFPPEREHRRAVRRICPVCAIDPDRGVPLAATIPLMLSCPEHGCRLEAEGAVRLASALEEPTPNRAAPEHILVLDRLTHEGLTTGTVTLPPQSRARRCLAPAAAHPAG